LAGESGIHLLTTIDTEKFKVKIGGDIGDWDAEKITRVKEAIEYIEAHAKKK
jgi:hypothetical protein